MIAILPGACGNRKLNESGTKVLCFCKQFCWLTKTKQSSGGAQGFVTPTSFPSRNQRCLEEAEDRYAVMVQNFDIENRRYFQAKELMISQKQGACKPKSC